MGGGNGLSPEDPRCAGQVGKAPATILSPNMLLWTSPGRHSARTPRSPLPDLFLGPSPAPFTQTSGATTLPLGRQRVTAAMIQGEGPLPWCGLPQSQSACPP